jgi:dienelactone hydrolase
VNGWVFERDEDRPQVRFAFVEKRGVKFGDPPKYLDDDDLPEEFLKHDTLEDRVSDVLWALDVLAMDAKVDRARIALLGHGEGAPVAAAAALRSPHVTHLGYFNAGGQPRLVELLYKRRLELHAEGIEAAELEEKMNDFFEEMAGIFEHPDDYTDDYLGTTPFHINSFGFRPPVENLLELQIPIYVAAGTANPAVPMASIDLIRLAFALYRKENLTFRVYPGLDHGFTGPDPDNPDGEPLFQFPMVFDEFCAWLME